MLAVALQREIVNVDGAIAARYLSGRQQPGSVALRNFSFVKQCGNVEVVLGVALKCNVYFYVAFVGGRVKVAPLYICRK